MKKRSLNMIILTVLSLVVFADKASAATGSVVGCNYGLADINTQPIAEYVTSRLTSSLKFHNVYNTYSPTKNIIEGETTIGNYFLESDVLYFAGHSNYSSMTWKGCTKNPVGIRAYDSNAVTENYTTLVGIGKFNLSKIKFVMLEGCETAKGNDYNISKYFVNKGANSSLGWTTQINTWSAKSWLTNFWDKISAGGTIKEANDYANSKSYMANSIKNTQIFGNTNQRLNNLTYTALKNPMKISFDSLSNNEYNFNIKETNNLKLQLEKIIGTFQK